MGPRRFAFWDWITATPGREALTWACIGIAGIAMAAGGLLLYGQSGDSNPGGLLVRPGSPTPTQIAPIKTATPAQSSTGVPANGVPRETAVATAPPRATPTPLRVEAPPIEPVATAPPEATGTLTAVPSSTAAAEPSGTASASATGTAAPTKTRTPSPTPTASPTATPTAASPTPTIVETSTASPTATVPPATETPTPGSGVS